MFDRNLLGTRLKELRQANNLTQAQVASNVGCLQSSLSNIERGIKPASFDIVIELANYYGVSIDYLLGATDIPQPSNYLQELLANAHDLGKYNELYSHKNVVAKDPETTHSAKPEDEIKEQIARIGKQAYGEALKKILDENGLLSIDGIRSGAKINDPDLDDMINFLSDLWILCDDDLKVWAKVQFSRAFPKDVRDEVEKKRATIRGDESTA